MKGRVEGKVASFGQQNAEFVLYVVTWLSFVICLVTMLLKAISFRTVGMSLFSGWIWLATWYAPLPVWGRAILTLLVLLGLGGMYRGANILPAPIIKKGLV